MDPRLVQSLKGPHGCIPARVNSHVSPSPTSTVPWDFEALGVERPLGVGSSSTPHRRKRTLAARPERGRSRRQLGVESGRSTRSDA